MSKLVSLALVATLTMTACTPRYAPVEKENPNVGGEPVPLKYDLKHLPEVTNVAEIVETVEEVEEVKFDNEYDNMIYHATKDTDVDPYLAIAISRLETGHYTSRAFVEGYNFGGITIQGKVASFDSISSGLDRFANLLGWYHRNGMTTAETMQSTYCPPNENWDEIVNEIYYSMVSEVK